MVKKQAKNTKNKVLATKAATSNKTTVVTKFDNVRIYIDRLITQSKKIKKYRSFRLTKRIKPEPKFIPTTAQLFKQTALFLWKYKKIFFLAAAVYVVVYILIIRSPITSNVGQIQKAVKNAVGDKSGTSFKTEFVTLGAVLSTSNNHGNSTLFIGSLFLISLIYIWMIRQLHSNNTFQVRDAIYQAPISLIPTFIILLVMVAQFFPFAFASFVYSIARTGGMFTTGLEDLSFFMVVIGIAILSFFWLTSTVMSLYIVTLPGMRPVAALKAGNDVVRFRRLTVFRRILGLVVTLVIFYLLMLLIIIRVRSGLTFWFAEAFQILVVPFVHIYLYKLYRALL